MVFVVVAGVAAAGSGTVSLWTDEAVTISAADRTWGQLWTLLGRIDSVHGLYYALMKPWVSLTGVHEVSLRLPSALASGATAVGMLLLARRLTTPSTAVLAALLCGLLPRMTWAGVEARPFVFSALAAVWATWALWHALESGGSWRWARYALLATVGVLTNIYLVMLVMGHGITVLLLRRRSRELVSYAVAAAATAVVTMPLLLLVRSQQAQLGTEGDRGVGFIVRRIVVNQVFLGETPTDGSTARWFELAWQAAAIVAALLGAALLVTALLRPARPGDLKREVIALTVPWALLPTAVVACYAVAVAPIYQPRYLTFTVPAVALLLALGVRSLRRNWVAATCLVVLAVTSATVVVSQRLPYSKPFGDWAAAAEVVARCSEPGESVLFEPRESGAEVTRTTRRIAYAYPEAFVGLDDLTARRTGAETGTLDGLSSGLTTVREELADVSTLWVLFGVNDPEAVVERDASLIVAAGLRETGRWEGPSTTVVRYQADDGSPPTSDAGLDCA